jgi:hypothetical protein
MALSTAQKQALKADIAADPTLGQLAHTSDSAFAIAALYNLPASPDFFVWQTAAPTRDIFDAITWANYTPADAADNTVTFSNRLLVIQTKQMNLQNMLVGRDSVDASKANVRLGLRDAVINLPAGASGANVSAGGASGATVMNALTRKATRLEKLLVTSSPSTGGVTAGVMGYEGAISSDDVINAWNS